MDFLSILGIYTVVFGTGVFVLYFRNSTFFTWGPQCMVKNGVAYIFNTTIPASLLTRISDYLHSRNQVLKCVYAALVLLGHGVWVLDMMPILLLAYPKADLTTVPVAIAFLNLLLYHLSCNTDPGEITAQNLIHYQDVYSYDGRLYQVNRTCSTCNLPKPARSKHCSICDRCVHRFDHHCVWTNNDVGGLNARYFILFLFTLLVILIEGVLVGGHSLILFSDHINLMDARVVLADNTTAPITYGIAFQELFMKHPRLVFLVCALILLIPAVGGFLLYHLYLTCTNQTTNERYKPCPPSKPAKPPECSHGSDRSGAQLSSAIVKRKGDKQNHKYHKLFNHNLYANVKSEKKHLLTRKRPYDKGPLLNTWEVFFPFSILSNKN